MKNNANETVFIPNIEIIQHKNMDLTDNPCDARAGYSLTECVQKSFGYDVRCKLPLISLELGVPICRTFQQFKKHEYFYKKIGQNEQKRVLNLT